MMNHYVEQHKVALIASLEIVLMFMGNEKYNLIVSKLNALHNISIRECYEHPEYLKPILKEVYKEDYAFIISEVKARLEELIDDNDLAHFFKVMES